jgi:hypothetical protein
MLLLPIVLVAHVVVSAPTFGAVSAPIAVAGMASSASWGTNMVASTIDLNQIRRPFLCQLRPQLPCDSKEVVDEDEPDPVRDGHRDLWAHTLGTWATSLAFLLAIIALASYATWRTLTGGGGLGIRTLRGRA